MKSEVNIAKGKSFQTLTKDKKFEVTICFGNTSGYMINRPANTFQLIFMTGTLSSEFELHEHIEKGLKDYFK